ncbi:MAG: sugar-binding transcriptional regulator [Eubacteriales bacterium]|nr:sugar-binding transcriptional regulator [Eubacteriales bacterium]
MDYEEILMTRIAWYYYFEGLTQQNIADRLGINRLKVNKLLDKARQNGIIKFQMNSDRVSQIEAEKQLMDKYGLKDVFIMPSTSDETHINNLVAEAACMYINRRLRPDSIINMGYGDTQNKLLNKLATIAENTITCVSLTGGVNFYLPNSQSNIFNAKLHLLPAPLISSNEEVAKAIFNESSVKEILRMIQLADMTVVGIGSMNVGATIFKNGLISRNDYDYLKMKGAAGDILCHFIDADGNLIDTYFENRLISVSLEQLKTLKNVIGIAGGMQKVKAIKAALKGDYLDILITDSNTAKAVLESD